MFTLDDFGSLTIMISTQTVDKLQQGDGIKCQRSWSSQLRTHLLSGLISFIISISTHSADQQLSSPTTSTSC